MNFACIHGSSLSRLSRLSSGLLAALALTACASPGSDAAIEQGSEQREATTFTPAVHAPFTLVTDHGGPILPHMKLVTITFPGYAFDSTIDAMGEWIVGSDYFASVTSEYGVGRGTHQHVVLTEAAPSSIDPLPFITELVQSGAVPGATAGETDYLYLLVSPPGTSTDILASLSCEATHDVGGSAWHDEATAPHRFAYAMIPTCGHEDLTSIEMAIAHEIIEAATDPFPFTAPAHTNQAGPWSGEVGDLCNLPRPINGFSVPTIWSNHAASLGGDPCLPANPAYFNVSATAPALVDPGQTLTIDVTGWSTASRSDWTLAAVAVPASTFDKPGKTFTPGVSVSASSMNNARTSTLTVTVPADAASGSVGTWHMYSVDTGDDYSDWPMSVTVR